ncbi:hypothetical protein MAA5396_04694 [Marinovum algicola]|uniref:Uncharacterized protein n=1 Tax=Marinovum algicola TaxID=42444 RepID=A0A975ZRA2_9RHOB|nr:hypothetical protein [Marinovum algicola]SEK12370.1 hypothetical protein SAMN04487940_1525 [Marinovum algicola]SLN76345.1 hypothetical protein MAA5396_04694 [Marinovum algicola]
MCDTLRQRVAGQIDDLSKTSKLVVAGRLEDQHDDADFIRCLNGLLAARPKHWGKAMPKSEADAVDEKGKLHRQAELVAFGDWLLVERHPGYRRKGGPEPDLRLVLKTVAAAMLELSLRPIEEKHGRDAPRQKHRTQAINKADLARRWKPLFGETREPEFFDSQLRQLRRLLSGYRSHVGSGSARFGGKVVTSSPNIEAIRAGITPKPAKKKAPLPASSVTPPVPAVARAFKIDLPYSSDEKRQEYRGKILAAVPLPHLEYKPTLLGVPSASKPQKLVLRPDVEPEDYRFHAVVDRMVLLVETKKITDERSLQRRLTAKTDATTYVRDPARRKDKDRENWGKPLPELDGSKSAGHCFAILVQDPEPAPLSSLLKVLREDIGLNGPVQLHLLEISIDIFPRSSSETAALLQREKMVALLHRHHWAPASAFPIEDGIIPRYGDARTSISSKPKYLFQHPKKASRVSDLQVKDKDKDVRDRLLSETPGDLPYLNATLYRGATAASAMTSAQHKIADRRNPGKNTLEYLAFKDRRARLEVTLSWEQTLAGRGVKTVDDLATVSFRKLTSPYLSLWLPVVPDEEDLLKDIEVQLQSRGVYGIELRNRARYERDRETLRGSGKPLPRRTASQAIGLVRWSEMNDRIGTALDDLRKRWKTFRPS